jgi:integrase
MADVQLAKGEIRLMPGKTKTRTGRTIPISGRLRALLEMRRLDPAGEEHPPTAYAYGNEIGQRVLDVKTAWNAACRRAEISDLHFHDLRRESGSRWLEGGVALHIVKDWLGHTSVAQTSTYLASTLQTGHEAMRRFDELRGALHHSAANGEQSGHARQSSHPAEDLQDSVREHLSSLASLSAGRMVVLGGWGGEAA